MTYQFELDVTTSIDAQTVERIVANLIEERTGKQIDRIITRMTDGRFDGFTVHFVTEVAETKNKRDHIIDKTFKVFKWDS